VGPYTPFQSVGTVLPAYGLFHLSGALSIGRGEVQLGVRNLLDHIYAELRAGDFVVPGQPRTVFVTVRYPVGRPADER